MWTVIYMTQSKETADRLRAALDEAELLVKVRPVNKAGSNSNTCFEILVPESEVDEAHNIILANDF